METTRQRVIEARERGLSLTAIALELGLSKSTVAYHLRRLGEVPDDRYNRRYDWVQVQSFYDAGHSITQCQRRFGFSRQAWNAARLRGDVRSRPHGMPLEELLVGVRNRSHLKARLVGAGLKENRCEACGLTEWLGRPLAMALHHVNGDGADNPLLIFRRTVVDVDGCCDRALPTCHQRSSGAIRCGRRRGARRAARRW